MATTQLTTTDGMQNLFTTEADTTYYNPTTTRPTTTTTPTTAETTTTEITTTRDAETTAASTTTAVFRSTGTSPVSSISSIPDRISSGIPLGAIIGAVLAAVVIVIIVIVIVIVVIRRQKRGTKPKQKPITSNQKTKNTGNPPGKQTLKEVMAKKRETVMNIFNRRKESIDIQKVEYVQTSLPVSLKRISQERESNRQTSRVVSELSEIREDGSRPVSSSSAGSVEFQRTSGNGVDNHGTTTPVFHYNAQTNEHSMDVPPQDDYFNIRDVESKHHINNGLDKPTSGFEPPQKHELDVEAQGGFPTNPTLDQEDYMNSSQVMQIQGKNYQDHDNTLDDIIGDDEVIQHNGDRRPTYDQFSPPPPVPDPQGYANTSHPMKVLQQSKKGKSTPQFDSVDESAIDDENQRSYNAGRRPTFEDLGLPPAVPQFDQEDYMNVSQVVHSPKQGIRGNKRQGEETNDDYMTSGKGFSGIPTIISDSNYDGMQEEYVTASELADLPDYATPSSISIHTGPPHATGDYATPSSIKVEAEMIKKDHGKLHSESIEDDDMKYSTDRRPTYVDLGIAPQVPQQLQDYIDMNKVKTPELVKRSMPGTPTQKGHVMPLIPLRHTISSSSSSSCDDDDDGSEEDEYVNRELPDYATPRSINAMFEKRDMVNDGREYKVDDTGNKQYYSDDEQDDSFRSNTDLPEYATPSSISVMFGEKERVQDKQEGDHGGGWQGNKDYCSDDTDRDSVENHADLPEYATPSSISVMSGKREKRPYDADYTDDRTNWCDDEHSEYEEKEGDLPEYATPSSISVMFGADCRGSAQADNGKRGADLPEYATPSSISVMSGRKDRVLDGEEDPADRTYSNFMQQNSKYNKLLGGGIRNEDGSSMSTGQVNRNS